MKQPECVEKKDVDELWRQFYLSENWQAGNFDEYDWSCSDPVSDWLSQPWLHKTERTKYNQQQWHIQHALLCKPKSTHWLQAVKNRRKEMLGLGQNSTYATDWLFLIKYKQPNFSSMNTFSSPSWCSSSCWSWPSCPWSTSTSKFWTRKSRKEVRMAPPGPNPMNRLQAGSFFAQSVLRS